MSGQDRLPVRVLADWVEGRLGPEQAAAVADQVESSDDRTRRTVEWLHSFLVDAREFPLHEPPPYLRQRLSQHFTAWAASRAALDSLTPREIEVELVFDSRVDLALAGVRGSADEDRAYHLAFTSDPADLVLDVYPVGDRFRIDGQVLLKEPTDSPLFAASASGPGVLVRSVDGDESGRFELNEVSATTTHVQAQNGVVTVVAAVRLHDRE